jgi:hypothetical protein
VATMALAMSISAVVTVMRRRRVARLRLNPIGSGIRSGRHGRHLLSRNKEQGCRCYQKQSQSLFQVGSPKKMKSPVRLLNHRSRRKSVAIQLKNAWSCKGLARPEFSGSLRRGIEDA